MNITLQLEKKKEKKKKENIVMKPAFWQQFSPSRIGPADYDLNPLHTGDPYTAAGRTIASWLKSTLYGKQF